MISNTHLNAIPSAGASGKCVTGTRDCGTEVTTSPKSEIIREVLEMVCTQWSHINVEWLFIIIFYKEVYRKDGGDYLSMV